MFCKWMTGPKVNLQLKWPVWLWIYRTRNLIALSQLFEEEKYIWQLPLTVIVKMQPDIAFRGLALSLAVHVTSRTPMANLPCGGTHSTAGTSPELSVAMGSFQVTLADELPWYVVTLMSLGHVFASNDGGSVSGISKTKYINKQTKNTKSHRILSSIWLIQYRLYRRAETTVNLTYSVNRLVESTRRYKPCTPKPTVSLCKSYYLQLPLTVIVKMQPDTTFGWLALSLAVHVTSRSPMGNLPCGGTHTMTGTTPELSVAIGSSQVTIAVEFPWSAVTLVSLGHVFAWNDGGSVSRISIQEWISEVGIIS